MTVPLSQERLEAIRKIHAERLAEPSLIRQDAESAVRTCERAWEKNERAVITVGAGFLHLIAQDALALLAAVERQRAILRWVRDGERDAALQKLAEAERDRNLFWDTLALANERLAETEARWQEMEHSRPKDTPRPDYWRRLRCWFSCEGTYPLAFMGTPFATPCPRCGRVRFWS